MRDVPGTIEALAPAEVQFGEPAPDMADDFRQFRRFTFDSGAKLLLFGRGQPLDLRAGARELVAEQRIFTMRLDVFDQAADGRGVKFSRDAAARRTCSVMSSVRVFA